MEIITSRSNRLIKHIRKLTSDREYRRSCGLYFGEGPKLLAEALKAGTAIEAVVTAQGVDLPGLDGLWRAEVPADLLDSLCDTRTPQGVLFLAPLPSTKPPERLEGGRWLILDGLQDPGNLGTIIRGAEAFGVTALVLGQGCPDRFSPKVLRSTMGGVFRLAENAVAGYDKRVGCYDERIAAETASLAFLHGEVLCNLFGRQ